MSVGFLFSRLLSVNEFHLLPNKSVFTTRNVCVRKVFQPQSLIFHSSSLRSFLLKLVVIFPHLVTHTQHRILSEKHRLADVVWPTGSLSLVKNGQVPAWSLTKNSQILRSNIFSSDETKISVFGLSIRGIYGKYQVLLKSSPALLSLLRSMKKNKTSILSKSITRYIIHECIK